MNKKLHFALTVALASVFVFSIGMGARQRLENQDRAASYETASRFARVSLPELETFPEKDAIVQALEKIDLEALQAINEDVIGWLCIPDTEISYPLLQGEDNDFYLEHTWEGERCSGGSICMDWRSSSDLTDFHTILYGHRMRDGSMFGALKYYKTQEFWQEHPSVYIVDNSGVYVYNIFAAWEPKVNSIVYSHDIDTAEARQEFLDACLVGSEIDTTVIPDQEDKILTLSTCTGYGYHARWVVQGALAKEYIRNKDDTKNTIYTD